MASTGVTPMPADIKIDGRRLIGEDEFASRSCDVDDLSGANLLGEVGARDPVAFAFDAEPIEVGAGRRRQRVGTDDGSIADGQAQCQVLTRLRRRERLLVCRCQIDRGDRVGLRLDRHHPQRSKAHPCRWLPWAATEGAPPGARRPQQDPGRTGATPGSAPELSPPSWRCSDLHRADTAAHRRQRRSGAEGLGRCARSRRRPGRGPR